MENENLKILSKTNYFINKLTYPIKQMGFVNNYISKNGISCNVSGLSGKARRNSDLCRKGQRNCDRTGYVFFLKQN